MDVVQARKMVARGAVRAKQQAEVEAGAKKLQVGLIPQESPGRPETHKKQTNFERKADLGQIFGTRKAKKAIQETTMNAISPQKKAGTEDSPTKIDAASRAMLSSVGEITSTMATREKLQAEVDEAKPVPKANLAATEVYQVYDPKVIIGGDVLNLVPVREWQEKAQHGETIQTVSRYVAARVNQVANNPDGTTRLRVLRYYYFVLLFYLNTKASFQEKGSRVILPRDKLREAMDPAPEAVIENIRRKFSDGGIMRKFHTDMIKAHCCAFACIIDNYEVDTQALKDDLRMDQAEVNQFFHEIGGKVKPSKANGKTRHIGRLTLPLEFPKQRHLAPKRR